MKTGVILLNMGGPNNLHEVEVFLKNMFNDKNIITVKSDFLRSFIAFMITTFRKKTAINNYKQIGGFSPIVNHTQNLVDKLNAQNATFDVDFAMSYTPPFSSKAIEKLKHLDSLVVLPLYPHYSTTTTKSSLEDFYRYFNKTDSKSRIFEVKEFYKDENYNNLIVKLIKNCLKDKKAKDYDLIFSAHSLPQKIVNSGDPYQKQICEHVDILKNLLIKKDLHFNKIHLAYQSKLGPIKWLEPQLGEKLKEIKNRKVIIFPISFTIDNSETDFELSIEYRHEANELGFEEYLVCLCPNDDIDFVHLLSSLIQEAINK